MGCVSSPACPSDEATSSKSTVDSAGMEPMSSPTSTSDVKFQIHLEGRWVDCTDQECHQINKKLSGGSTQFQVESRGQTYDIDFSDPSKPSQTNVRTKKLRNLRSVGVDADQAKPLEPELALIDVDLALDTMQRRSRSVDTPVARGDIADDLEWMSVPGSSRKERRQRAPMALQVPAAAAAVKIQIQLGGNWIDCEDEQSTQILQRLQQGVLEFQIHSRGTCYLIDFSAPPGGKQTNVATQKERRLRLVEREDDSRLGIPSEIQQQIVFGPQSKRGKASQSPLSLLKDDPHAQKCFTKFLENEERLCGEYAVFYHSYSYSALIYEVHAAVGSVLFRFKSKFATLPRILVKDFDGIPDASTLMTNFNEIFHDKLKDHDPRFRAVGLSVMCSLVSTGPEACIPMVFVGGYGCKDVTYRGVLENVLRSCYVPEAMVTKVADDIIELSHKHGLDVSQFGGKQIVDSKAGHLLQIFLKRNLVDAFAYAALPYGPIDNTRMPISNWMNGSSSFSFGQARVVAHPKYFMQAKHVRMYVASASPTFHANRQAFQEDMVNLLDMILGAPELREKAATGIYGGKLPSWWSADEGRAD